MPEHILQQIHRFFSDYKILEKKVVEIEKFEGREAALEVVKESITLYDKTFGEKEEKESS